MDLDLNRSSQFTQYSAFAAHYLFPKFAEAGHGTVNINQRSMLRVLALAVQ